MGFTVTKTATRPTAVRSFVGRPSRAAGSLLLASALLAAAAPAGLRASPGPAGGQDAAKVAERAATARALIDEALRHENAEGTPRDYARAHELYCQAARLNNADALHRLGWMYANGRGVARNDAIAHSLFSRAAEYGSEVAERLAGMVRAEPGAAASLPDCLVVKKVRDTGPTPQVDDPATFVAAPDTPARRKLVQAVVAQAREYRVDPRLVFAIMRAESNFDPSARSPKNAQGLMQLIPETAERFAVADILDPVQNVRGGVRYLRWLLSYFRGDVVLALAAYNAGEGAVDRFRGVPPYAETMAYVARIRALYPHDRHPYDPRVAEASPVVAAAASAASPVAAASAAGPRIATPVRYFLGKIDAPLAQSNR